MNTHGLTAARRVAAPALLALALSACGGGGGADSAAGAAPAPSPVPAPSLSMRLLAGDIGGPGWIDGPAADARFNDPAAIAIDAAGALFVADEGNHVIRRVAVDGTVSTFAGGVGQCGSADGPPDVARFCAPTGLAFDAAGRLYVADRSNALIRRIAADGTVVTVAGTALQRGAVDATGAAARFASPSGLTLDDRGDLLVADAGNATVRRVTPAGVVSTVAGAAGQSGHVDGAGAAARFRQPMALAFGNGTLYVVDSLSHTIRAIDAAGNVTTLIGADEVIGTTDGTFATTRLGLPQALAWVGGASPRLLIGDFYGTIRSADLGTAVVVRVAGELQSPTAARDGPIATAGFDLPRGIAVDASGRVYVADAGYSSSIRRIDAAGVTTFAGRAARFSGADGQGSAAGFRLPQGLAVLPNGDLAVADHGNYTLRRITPAGVVSTISGAAGRFGHVDGPPSSARWRGVFGIVVEPGGGLLVADGISTIRRVDAAGTVATLIGAAAQGGVDGPYADARLNNPRGVALGPDGSLAIADTFNRSLRRAAVGSVTTMAGTAGSPGTTDGAAATARLLTPLATAYDRIGNLWFTDGSAVRRLTPSGIVETVAGSVVVIGSADGVGSAARFGAPSGLAIDDDDNVYVSDSTNSTIRRVTPGGVVTTVVGVAGEAGIRLGASPRLSRPAGLAVLPGRRLAVAMPAGIFVVQLP